MAVKIDIDDDLALAARRDGLDGGIPDLTTWVRTLLQVSCGDERLRRVAAERQISVSALVSEMVEIGLAKLEVGKIAAAKEGCRGIVRCEPAGKADYYKVIMLTTSSHDVELGFGNSELEAWRSALKGSPTPPAALMVPVPARRNR